MIKYILNNIDNLITIEKQSPWKGLIERENLFVLALKESWEADRPVQWVEQTPLDNKRFDEPCSSFRHFTLWKVNSNKSSLNRKFPMS